jgi:hypothetical protein
MERKAEAREEHTNTQKTQKHTEKKATYTHPHTDTLTHTHTHTHMRAGATRGAAPPQRDIPACSERGGCCGCSG